MNNDLRDVTTLNLYVFCYTTHNLTNLSSYLNAKRRKIVFSKAIHISNNIIAYAVYRHVISSPDIRGAPLRIEYGI